MTDYKEEQRNELEALESIYPDELKVIDTDPYAVFEISLVSQQEDGQEESDEQASCTLKFAYTKTYPDDAPIIEVTDSENIEDDQINEILDLSRSEAEENLGMVMVFTIVSAVQERLTCMVEESKKRKEEEEERKKKAEEELEMKKFAGTRVTIENFLNWKTAFDAEMAELKKKKKDVDNAKSKFTGIELFMRDESLMDSDVQFLQAEGESVEVDESLFQDLDDLDIGDEDPELAGID